MSCFLNNIQNAPFIIFNDHPDQYYEQITNKIKDGFKNLEKYDVDASFIIKDSFFSARNINLIQKWLINDVRKKTKILIPYQKIEHIVPVMNIIYNNEGRNLPFALKEQIYELDKYVVKYLADTVIPELQARTKYFESLETAGYIDRPQFMGAKGQRSLPSTLIV
jgi:hypothetical protein